MIATAFEDPTAVECLGEREFKLTEVGKIPTDWDLIELEDACVTGGLVRGPFGGSLKKEFFKKKGYKVYEQRDAIYGDLKQGRYFVDDRLYSDLNRFAVAPGDFIVSCSGTIGAICRIEPDSPKGVINQALLKITVDTSKVDPIYFYHVFASASFQSRIKENTHGGAMQNLVGMDIFRGTKFPLPKTLEEQEAIGQAISETELLVRTLETLIEKKRLIRQGALQELLSGRIRFAGFAKDWAVVPIGSLFSFKNGLNKAKAYFGSGTPIINYMDVFSHPGLKECHIVGRVNVTKKEIENFSAKKGDVFFTRTSETLDEIGIASALTEDLKNAVFSGFVLRGRPIADDLDDEFKKYCFSSDAVRRQIVSKGTYTTRALTNGRALSSVLLTFPATRSEQRAIAEVLSEMDAELGMLEAYLSKARQIKLGMMQELLTGRVRLV